MAALVACWPRERGRGYPFLALMALLVAVVSPVVSLGGTRPLLLGTAIAALTVCFLWLERLPLRPGLGVALLLGVALAGALPLAAVADRGEPWFDYKAFAEDLGPDDPVRFSWAQQYGPIDWPRDGNEVMRVKSDEPHYWKAANLELFDGSAFSDAGPLERGGDDPTTELREDWRNQPGQVDDIEVSIRRMRHARRHRPRHDHEGRGRDAAAAAVGRARAAGRVPASCAAATPTRPRSTSPSRPRASCRPPTRPASGSPRERGSGDDRAVPARSPADDPVGRRRRARTCRHGGRALPAVRRRRRSRT